MALSGEQKLLIARQPTLATPVNPSILVPFNAGTLNIEEVSEEIRDSGRRGNITMDYDVVEGVGMTNFQVEAIHNQGNATVLAPIGYFITNLLTTDSYTPTENTGSSGTYDHYIKIGTTKSYITAEELLLGGSNDRRLPGLRINEMTFSWNAGEGMLMYKASGVGRTVSKVTGQVVSDGTGEAFRGWEADLVVNGTEGATYSANNTNLVNAEFKVTRRNDGPEYTSQASQDFNDFDLGEIEVTADLTFTYKAVTEADLYRGNTKGQLAARFTKGTADTSSERTFGIAFGNASMLANPLRVNTGGVNALVQLSARGVWSTENGPFSGSAVNGPVEFHIVEDVATAYTA